MLSKSDSFWNGKRVLITGHTGFKGAWLTLVLKALGADVAGYGLDPVKPSLFRMLYPEGMPQSAIEDIRDGEKLRRVLSWHAPEIVFHMAAQPEIIIGYKSPLETFEINTLGTIRLLDSLRDAPDLKCVVVVTTDKVYADRHSPIGYMESSELGGGDPYSGSKSCADIAAQVYGRHYLNGKVAVARGGNVVGGGDWSRNRLIPNCIRAVNNKIRLEVYEPEATRPWQHVADCLRGYMLLAEAVCGDASFCRAWNFGPKESLPIRSVVETIFRAYGKEPEYDVVDSKFEETKHLRLDSRAAKQYLGWEPMIDTTKAVELTAQWHQRVVSGESPEHVCLQHLEVAFG